MCGDAMSNQHHLRPAAKPYGRLSGVSIWILIGPTSRTSNNSDPLCINPHFYLMIMQTTTGSSMFVNRCMYKYVSVSKLSLDEILDI